MRAFTHFALLSLVPVLLTGAEKLTFDDRVELTRGLTAELER